MPKFGWKHPIVFKNTKFNGYAAPIWFNPLPKCFLLLALVTFVAALAILLYFIFATASNDDCGTNAEGILIACIAIGFFESNFLLCFL